MANDTLTTASRVLPRNWGMSNYLFNYKRFAKGEPPSKCYDCGGIVWMGKAPCTRDDVKALKAVAPFQVKRIDKGSKVGTADPNYSTWWSRNKDKEQYQQHVG